MLFLLVLLSFTLAGVPESPPAVQTPSSSVDFTPRDIGDTLLRSVSYYVSLPKTKTEAIKSEWKSYGDFDPNLGEPLNQNSEGPSASEPVTLYFGKSGQVSGIGMDIFGDVKSQMKGTYFNVNERGFGGNYHISVSFRSPADIASTQKSKNVLGNQLVLNQGTLNLALPLTEEGASKNGYQKGSCFAKMGTHYFRDYTTNDDSLSWVGGNLEPIVLMFNKGLLSAFFFLSSDVQQSVIPPSSNQWDPISLPNSILCWNLCNEACTFTDNSYWSTGHIYLRDPSEATCKDGCTTACC